MWQKPHGADGTRHGGLMSLKLLLHEINHLTLFDVLILTIKVTVDRLIMFTQETLNTQPTITSF